MRLRAATITLALLFLAPSFACRSEDAELAPGPAVDCSKIVFNPARWEERKLSTQLMPWEGKHLVFLTTGPDFDKKVMARFVARLDAGWEIYAELLGVSPRPFKQINSKATIAAVPDAALTCGYGCGFVGSTGIEASGFYAKDYPLAGKTPDAFSHYYFYEMGRNYYVFGERHNLFVTGYAVFMRYVCMDRLKCADPDAGTRKTIEKCEELYAESSVEFLDAFTNLAGKTEKDQRLKEHDGRAVVPSDQPVMYATAMLKLRRDCGGEEWVKRFFAALMKCPPVKPDTKEAALKQSAAWLIAASIAAKKDLTPIFVDRWRLPLGKPARKALETIDWTQEKLDPTTILRSLEL